MIETQQTTAGAAKPRKIRLTGVREYKITEEIGTGAYGTVFRGFRKSDPEKSLAFKVIDSRRSMEALIEPELLSRLQHENIVRLHDYFLSDRRLVLVMDHVEGGDLQAALDEKGSFDPDEAIVFLIQIAQALAHAHQHDVVHGDLKLSNILIEAEPAEIRNYVLADFGVGRIIEGIRTKKSVRGTYHYMAPEQLRGRPSKQSDLWALGVAAYILLTGRKPFDGEDLETLAEQILFQTPAPASELAEIPFPELDRILAKLLQKSPLLRYGSAEELLADLAEIEIRPIAAARGGASPDDTGRTMTTWESKARKKARRSGWICFFWLLVASLPEGVIGRMLSYGGALMVFNGSERKKSKGLIAAGLLTGLAGLFLAVLMSPETNNGTWQLIFSFIAVHYFVRGRRLKRELFLVKIFRESNREDISQIVQNFIDIHPQDLSVRERLIEIFLAEERFEDAIVEAKLLLQIDPYNFRGNLLLAHAYFEVGLKEECLSVCRSYLSVSGQSFEFSDLAKRCAPEEAR